MMISLYKRAAEALNCVRYITGFPFLARESSHQAIFRFNKASFMSLCFAPPPSPLVLSSQRDAQVAWREPQKAFGHQPSTQTAQVPGGGRGHQRGPQSFPLSGGHQQCIHRGANTADHRLLWISALECEPQEWVQQCFTIVYTWGCYFFGMVEHTVCICIVGPCSQAILLLTGHLLEFRLYLKYYQCGKNLLEVKMVCWWWDALLVVGARGLGKTPHTALY